MPAKTVTIQRANVILEISEADIDRYMAKGYNVIDSRGNIIKESVPTNLGTLQKAYVDHTNEIARLKQENANLTATIEELKTKKSGRTKK